jgi:putative transposase
MHTDRGSQYHSSSYRNALRSLEIWPSNSRTGSCLDGAAAESFSATIKTGIGTETWPNRASERRDIETWIIEYNQRLLHSALGYQTPIETRRAYGYRQPRAGARCLRTFSMTCAL